MVFRRRPTDVFIAGLPMLALFAFDFAVSIRYNFYEAWPPLSAVMHVVGGFVTAWSLWRLAKFGERRAKLNESRVNRRSDNTRRESELSGLVIKPAWLLWLGLISLTGLIGIGWEVYEFFLDMVVPVAVQPSVADTVGDLVGDLVGAAAFCLLVNFYNQRSRPAGQV